MFAMPLASRSSTTQAQILLREWERHAAPPSLPAYRTGPPGATGPAHRAMRLATLRFWRHHRLRRPPHRAAFGSPFSGWHGRRHRFQPGYTCRAGSTGRHSNAAGDLWPCATGFAQHRQPRRTTTAQGRSNHHHRNYSAYVRPRRRADFWPR